MNTVQTIQDALERRARNEGAEEAKRLMEAIPYLDTITAYCDGEVREIAWHNVYEGMLSALTRHLTAKRLDALTRELLESINEIAALKEGLEQHLQENER